VELVESVRRDSKETRHIDAKLEIGGKRFDVSVTATRSEQGIFTDWETDWEWEASEAEYKKGLADEDFTAIEKFVDAYNWWEVEE